MRQNRKNILVKSCIIGVTALTIGVTVCVKSNVKLAASSYVYDFWKNVIPSSEGLTYKETYYYSDIFDAETHTSPLERFDTLTDMEVYDSVIYLLDSRHSTTSDIPLANGTSYQVSGVSQVIVINQDFGYEAIADEFLISDEVRNKFDEFYHFGHWSGLEAKNYIELEDITKEQAQSGELVDVYDLVDTTKTVQKNASGQNFVAYEDFSYNENRGSSLALYNNQQLISPANYHVSVYPTLKYSYLASNTAAAEVWDLDKIVSKVKEADINVVSAYREATSQEDIRTVGAEVKIEDAAERKFPVIEDSGLTFPEAKISIVFLEEELTSDQYTVNTEEGTLEIIDESLLKELAPNIYQLKVTIDLGEQDFYDNYILINDEDVDKLESLSAIKPQKEVTPAMSSSTYITFDSVSEGTNVQAIFKYIATQGRAPYLPYSKDMTKAAVRLNNAQGITATQDYIYVADTENYRILKIRKSDLLVTDVILTPNDSSFYQIYNSEYKCKQFGYGVAYETIKEVNSYYSETMPDGILTFRPKKIAVTSSGVCYCVAESVYLGLLEFTSDTLFSRYLGKNLVTVNALKQIWKSIWSEAQVNSQSKDLPSYFNNLAISDDGFLYATSDPDEEAVANLNLVKVINTKGNDILHRNGYVPPDGDAVYQTVSNKDGVVLGSSLLSSVAISKIGNFTVTDIRRGRIFTYDNEGNLLYISGKQPGGADSTYTGAKSDSLVNPIASDYLYRTYLDSENNEIVEETLIVLDQASNTILLFETTEFGEAVNTATDLYQNGKIKDTYLMHNEGLYITVNASGNYQVIDEEGNVVTKDVNGNPITPLYDIEYDASEHAYDIIDNSGTVVAKVTDAEVGQKILISEGAESYWRKVIKMNTNYELAYLGLGKALNRNGQYEEAMKYFKLAHNAQYYSKAFSAYRDNILSENFGLIMIVVISLVVVVAVSKISKAVIAKNEKLQKKGQDE